MQNIAFSFHCSEGIQTRYGITPPFMSLSSLAIWGWGGGGPSGHKETVTLVLTEKKQNELAGRHELYPLRLLHFAVLCSASELEGGN